MLNKQCRLQNAQWQQKTTHRILTVGILFIYFFLVTTSASLFAQTEDNKTKNTRSEANATNSNKPQDDKSESFFSRLFESTTQPDAAPDTVPVYAGKIAISFLLATLLSAIIAFRPRRKLAITQPNPYVAQTQILLSVIAAAMMMIVSDNAARAFGIFAAASLVRYRTNIRDPKETSVLLACLGIGLAAGVRRWEIALILTAFIMILLLILEAYEPKQVFRMMELKVKSRDVEKTDAILKRMFKKRHIQAELRKMDMADKDDDLGTILYAISASPTISTDQLTEYFFSADPDNIDTIEWEQKKNNSYLYR